MIKVMSIFGTRPEAIKMAPVIQELKRYSNIESIVCVSAQHREMLDSVLQIFKIVPDYDMNIMKHGQTLQSITTAILEGLDPILTKEKPDIILVHGDTTTTFAAALSAFYHQIPIGHVEAGLRTYEKYSPYPEEMNRQMVSCMADLNFAPTETSALNLIKEHKNKDAIYITGNTAIDALKTTIHDTYHNEDLEWAKGSRLILLTAHRRENQGDGLTHIFEGVKDIVHAHPDVKVLYPCHMNPAIQTLAHEMFDQEDRIRVIDPLDVIDFHNVIQHSTLVLTDSGGIQEEAPSLNKPVLVLRDTTERPEGIEAGALKLVGTNRHTIFQMADELLTNKELYQKMSNAINPYGDGNASKRIASILLQYFHEEEPQMTNRIVLPVIHEGILVHER